MYLTVDRFEGDFAVVETENGKMYNIPCELVPEAKEKDVIRIYIDKEKTEKRTDDVRTLIDELFND